MTFKPFFTALLLTTLIAAPALASQDVTVVESSSDAADGLDLKSVADLFRTAKDTQAFEKSLNDPETGINNMDLNDDGEVDYIRVVEQAEGNTRVLILQAALAEKEFQDVATIEVEKTAADNVEVQVHGNVQVYGPNYYVRPVGSVFATAAFVSWLYRPNYVPYRSVHYWGYYPRWYRPWRPVHVNVYRARPIHVHRTVVYKTHTRSTVVGAKRIYKTPTTSVHVKKTLRNPTKSQKQVQVRRKTATTSAGGFGRKTTVTKGDTTVKHGKKVTHKDGQTTVKRGTKVTKGDKSVSRKTKTTKSNNTKTKTTKKTKTKGKKTKTKTTKKKKKNG